MIKHSLKIALWNLCKGLINKVQYVRDLLYTEKIDILFLEETEIKVDVNEKLLQKHIFCVALQLPALFMLCYDVICALY